MVEQLARSLATLVLIIHITTPLAVRARQLPPSAAQRMQQPGAEEEQLKRRTGTWNVTATFRPSPDGQALVSEGLVAERTMVGLYMQEVMKPASGSSVPDFRRVAYQYFSRVEGRWQYVSMDTRFPVGIMPAWSFGKETPDRQTLVFESLAFVGMGHDVEGRMVRSNLEVLHESDTHEFVRQRFVQADGTGREWLAVQYEYMRRP
jgi:hypothetical protein